MINVMNELIPTEPEIQPELPAGHRSGYVAVVGRPNAGKSTLMNRLLGQKLAITSPKPQTTRDQILGILTEPDAQILLLDTPGIHKPLHKLGEYMVGVAEATIREADVILWLVDGSVLPTDEDVYIAEMLQQLDTTKPLPTLLLGFNKVDLGNVVAILNADKYATLLDWSTQAGRPPHFARFSGRTGAGVPELIARIKSLLPEGPRYYSEDEVTDVQTKFVVAELIREKALHLLGDEIPHSIAIEVDEFSERDDNMTYISAIIYVERESQKPIVLGKGGHTIKAIGQAARPDIEELVGTRVYLELWVKVWERWRRREDMLRRLGYAME